MARRLLIIGALLFFVTGAIRAQAPAGLLHGRVVNALTREPIRGALVTIKVPITEGDYRTRDVGFLTGSDGRFQFANTDAQTIRASKTGWLRPDGERDSIDPAALATAAGLELALVPEARLEGRVVDRAGVPIANTPMRLTIVSGAVTSVQLALNPRAPSFRSQAVTTDDEGAFRVGDLRAGTYQVEGLEPDQPIVLAPGEVKTSLLIRQLVDRAVAAGGSRPTIVAGAPMKISGIVIDAVGRGVPRASVIVVRSNSNGAPEGFIGAVANEEGRFEIALGLVGGVAIPRGTYAVVASRELTIVGDIEVLSTGFLAMTAITAAAGATTQMPWEGIAERARLGGRTFALDEGQQATDVVVAMPATAALTGRVTDAAGDPIAASVRAVSITPGLDASGFITTDSTGHFRIADIPAGSYRLFADPIGLPEELYVFDSSNQPRTVVVPRAYFPAGSNSVGSRSIDATNGATVSGIDFLAVPTPASSVEVQAVPADGVGSVSAQLRLLDDLGVAWRQLPQSAMRGPNTVVAHGLPAGRYLFAVRGQATDALGGSTLLWGSVEVSTDGVTPQRVTAALVPGSDLAGQLVFDGSADKVTTIVRMSSSDPPDALNPWPLTSAVNVPPGNEFSFANIPPGRYSLSGSAPGWLLRSATVDGSDASGEFDLNAPRSGTAVLTFTSRVATVAGAVTGVRGERTRVLVIPSDRRLWSRTELLQVLPLGSDGAFRSGPLLAGDYVLAVVDVAAADTPEGLERAAAAGVRVTLGEGERRVQNLVAR